jgi:hypothetical protein
VIPAPILRIRRLIARGDVAQALAALRDHAEAADWHDARAVQAVAALLGVPNHPGALAVLDGHGWAPDDAVAASDGSAATHAAPDLSKPLAGPSA